MKYTRLAALTLLPLCVSLACGDNSGSGSSEKLPIEGEWETVVENVVFPYTADFESAGIPLITSLSIGRKTGNNLVNRGHVEVIFSEAHNGTANASNFPRNDGFPDLRIC